MVHGKVGTALWHALRRPHSAQSRAGTGAARVGDGIGRGCVKLIHGAVA